MLGGVRQSAAPVQAQPCVDALLHADGKELAVLPALRLPLGVEQREGLLEQLARLPGADGEDLLAGPGLREQLVRVRDDAGAEGRLRGLARDALEADRERAGEEGRKEHDHEGHGVAGLIGVEREARLDKEVVEEEHRRDGRAEAVAAV